LKFSIRPFPVTVLGAVCSRSDGKSTASFSTTIDASRSTGSRGSFPA